MLMTLFSLALAGTPTIQQSPVVPQQAIDFINQSQSQWHSSNQWVGQMTISQARQYASTTIRPSTLPAKNWGALSQYTSIPDSFDARKQWPSCVNQILDQGQCGSCWAFGAIQALGDRFCIQKGTKVTLSAQYMIDCDYGSQGCQGGFLDDAWYFLMNNGTPSSTCVPYKGLDQSCPSTCADKSTIQLYTAYDLQVYYGASSMQMAIMEGGPIQTCFTVYQDFMSYKGGIYRHVWGNEVGGHCVKPVGWGVQKGVKYWIIANSWNTSWGLQGYFWIEFGQCGIDSEARGGKAQLN